MEEEKAGRNFGDLSRTCKEDETFHTIKPTNALCSNYIFLHTIC
jgi:hypothetical protein